MITIRMHELWFEFYNSGILFIAWFNNFSRKIDEENKQRTGIKTSGLLDIHIITDEEIRKKDSWATHITSPYMSVKKIPLKK